MNQKLVDQIKIMEYKIDNVYSGLKVLENDITIDKNSYQDR